jgi:hypothetical protein
MGHLSVEWHAWSAPDEASLQQVVARVRSITLTHDLLGMATDTP